MGDEALALASKLSAGVPQSTGNRIFFDLAQRIFVQMPLWVGVVCLLALLAGFAFVDWRRGAPIGGTAIVLGAILSGSALAWLIVTAVGFLRAGVYWRAHPEITFVAIYATTLLGELTILRTLGSRLETRQLRPAYWLLFLILGALLALVAPGGIIYFLIPPAVVLAGIAISRWYRPTEIIGAFIGLVLLYLTWGELLAALEELFSPGPLWIVAPVAAIMTVPVLIEAQSLFVHASRRAKLLGSACIALLAWAFTAAVPAYSQDHQQRFTIEHLTQFPSGQSSWSILDDGTELPQAYSQFGPWHRGKLDFSERQRWLAKAPAASGIAAARDPDAGSAEPGQRAQHQASPPLQRCGTNSPRCPTRSTYPHCRRRWLHPPDCERRIPLEGSRSPARAGAATPPSSASTWTAPSRSPSPLSALATDCRQALPRFSPPVRNSPAHNTRRTRPSRSLT